MSNWALDLAALDFKALVRLGPDVIPKPRELVRDLSAKVIYDSEASEARKMLFARIGNVAIEILRDELEKSEAVASKSLLGKSVVFEMYSKIILETP